jgi:hypothetical protein
MYSCATFGFADFCFGSILCFSTIDHLIRIRKSFYKTSLSKKSEAKDAVVSYAELLGILTQCPLLARTSMKICTSI